MFSYKILKAIKYILLFSFIIIAPMFLVFLHEILSQMNIFVLANVVKFLRNGLYESTLLVLLLVFFFLVVCMALNSINEELNN